MKQNILMTVLVVILSFLSVTGFAKGKNIVWDNPSFICHNGNLKVTKVEMNDEETVLHIHYNAPGNSWVMFVPETYLLTDGKRYPVVSAEGINLGEQHTISSTGHEDYVFHFKPLPLTTKEFELHEGDGPKGFVISVITDNKWTIPQLQSKLFSSTWRNESTGDWEIGIFDDFIVYDCKFWEYKTKDAAKMRFVVANGQEEMTVSMKMKKNGLCNISINNSKPQLCRYICSRTLPDYPERDDSPHFKKEAFSIKDSITIIGYFANLPEKDKKEYANGKQLEFIFNYNLFDYSVQYQYANVDSLGCFRVVIPLQENCQSLSIMKHRFLFERGETYFYYHNYKNGKTLLMGKNARLQNEIISHPIYYHNGALSEIYARKDSTDELYIKSCEDLVKEMDFRENVINNMCRENPTLSERYRQYMLSDKLLSVGVNFHAKCNNSGLRIPPKKAWDIVIDRVWKNINPELHSNVFQGQFIRDVIDYHAMYNRTEGKEYLVKSQEEYHNALMMIQIDSYVKTAEELCNDSITSSVYMANKLYKLMNEQLHSIPKDAYPYLDKYVTVPGLKDYLISYGKKYDEISSRKLNLTNKNLSNEELAKIHDGEALLAKIIEPYKGRFVLLDIWGTWCAPCKNALSRSAVLWDALKDYDVVYLYLANNSDKKSWENVIKTYNLTADNCVHYNLPKDQQKAIEIFLKVSSFPTYKLFDKEGNLVDANVSPYNLSVLKSVFEKFNK